MLWSYIPIVISKTHCTFTHGRFFHSIWTNKPYNYGVTFARSKYRLVWIFFSTFVCVSDKQIHSIFFCIPFSIEIIICSAHLSQLHISMAFFYKTHTRTWKHAHKHCLSLFRLSFILITYRLTWILCNKIAADPKVYDSWSNLTFHFISQTVFMKKKESEPESIIHKKIIYGVEIFQNSISYSCIFIMIPLIHSKI